MADTQTMIGNFRKVLDGPPGGRLNRAIARIEERFGVYPEEDVETYDQLGDIFADSGKPELARMYLRKAFGQCRHLYGDEDPRTLLAMKELALLFQRQGKRNPSRDAKRRDFEEVEALLSETLKYCRSTLPRHNELTLRCKNDLGVLYLDFHSYLNQDRLAEAKTLFLEAYEAGLPALNEDHPLIGQLMNNLAITCRRLKSYEESQAWFQRALEFQRRNLLPSHPDIMRTSSNFGQLYYDMGEFAEAEPLLQEAVKTATSFENVEHLDAYLSRYASCLTALGRCSEQDLVLLLKGYELVKEEHRLGASATQKCIKSLVDLFETVGEMKIADQLREELAPQPDTEA